MRRWPALAFAVLAGRSALAAPPVQVTGYLTSVVDDDHGGTWLVFKGRGTDPAKLCHLQSLTLRCSEVPNSARGDALEGRYFRLFSPGPGAEPLLVEDRGKTATPRYQLVQPFTWKAVTPVDESADGLVWADGAITELHDRKMSSLKPGAAGPRVLDRTVDYMVTAPTQIAWRERTAEQTTRLFRAAITPTGFGPTHLVGELRGTSVKHNANGNRVCAYDLFAHTYTLFESDKPVATAPAAFIADRVWCGKTLSGVLDVTNRERVVATVCKGRSCASLSSENPFSSAQRALALVEAGLVFVGADLGQISIATTTDGVTWTKLPSIPTDATVTSFDDVFAFAGGAIVHAPDGLLLVLDQRGRPLAIKRSAFSP